MKQRQAFAHSLLDLWTSAPHVNNERPDHDHRDNSKYRFTQRFISEELTDVTAERCSEDVLRR